MKRLCLCCTLWSVVFLLSAAGVLVNRTNTQYQPAYLSTCDYEVQITNQVSEVMVTNTFINQSNGVFHPRFYFPIPRGANATSLRWSYGQEWHTAPIIGLPQHLPGGPSVFPGNFTVYMQLMPLIFDPADSLNVGDSLQVELTYVQLLNYNFGSVTQNLKNDYHLIQTGPLFRQSLEIDVYSDKQILDFNILDLIASETHTNNTAHASYLLNNQPANQSYRCVLQLSTSILSSWGLSTYLDAAPDDGDPGFFLYSLEEETLPTDSTFAGRINIVIDVSGSMSYEDRLVHAKAAASYVVNNLQNDDIFNVILFDHLVRPLWTSLQTNTQANRTHALNYIQNYTMPSLNGTNLYSAMQHAISQFTPAPAGVKNFILLLSDGMPTVGVQDPYQIINNINNQITNTNTDPIIHCFGVGSEVHYQLLTALAQQHHGSPVFLESSEIEGTISSFFDEMRNPILNAPVLSITPAGNVTELFPYPFPAVYGGMQYRIVGRYYTPQLLQLSLSGQHNGIPHIYSYDYQLANAADSTYSFIPKLWAAAKIDQLVIQYYSYQPNSAQAIALRQQIVDLSIAFGVVCIFTSFSVDPPDPPVEVDDDTTQIPAVALKLLPNMPNPFNPRTTIRFEVLADMQEEVELRIYNLKGQLVCVKMISVDGKGLYETEWDGKDLHGKAVGSGIYVYTIKCGKYLLTAKMTLLK